MKKVKFIIFLTLIITLFTIEKGRGAITSVIPTPATPTTLLSNGLGYYLAGITYQFDVQVTDPAATAWGDISDVTLTITNTTDIVVSIASPVGTGVQTIDSNTGPVLVSATIPGGDTYNNFTVIFTITIRWDTAESSWAPVRNVTASASSTVPGPNTLNNTIGISYGVCSSIRVLNFSQNLEASDGMINPYYSDFDVSGFIVYNVPGVSSSDSVNTIDAGEVAQTELFLDGGATGFTGALNDDNPVITVTAGYGGLTGLANRSWTINATMATAPGADESVNSLAISTDRVLVTGLSVTKGGGRDDGDYHWRSRLVPGTVFTVSAQMENSGSSMVGNTTFTIDYNDGTEFDITIPNGSTSASSIIPGVSTPDPGTGNTSLYTYYVTEITGNSYGDQGDGSFPADTEIQTTNYTPQNVWWDYADPPYSGTGAIAINKVVSSAQSFTIYWTPVNTSTSLPDSPDGDFYEYRIYFRQSNTGDPFRQWDGDTTDDTTLRGLANNPWPAPVSDINLHFDASSWKYTTIPDQSIYTEYEYYITAIDIFGNETNPPATPYIVRTQPYSIDITLSDGITQYTNDSFADLTPTVRSFRETNIKVDINIITSIELPDTINVWFTTGDIDTSPDIVTPTNTINQSAFSNNTLFSSLAKRTGSNKWTAYLSTDTGIIAFGNSIRFIVESIRNNISVYSDSIIEAYPNQNPNNNEWTFYLGKRITVTPWPVRILNNVITNDRPFAYPAFYLSDDAFVTIKVFDIKGRPVATLLDNAYRRGGQNIKERGWRGTNKASKKLGVGLYYVHFKAKRATDGKVILNKFKKVVIAK